MSIISSDDIHLLHRVHIPAPLNSANYFRSNNLLLDAFNEKNKKREKKKKERRRKKEPKERSNFHSNDSFFDAFNEKQKEKKKRITS